MRQSSRVFFKLKLVEDYDEDLFKNVMPVRFRIVIHRVIDGYIDHARNRFRGLGANNVSGMETELRTLLQEQRDVFNEYKERIRALSQKIDSAGGNSSWAYEMMPMHIEPPKAPQPKLSDVTLVMRRDEVKTHNNDADNTWAITARLEKPLFGNFSGSIDFMHIYRQKFPYIRDPKGFFGDLRGYGGMGHIIFRPTFSEKLSPYLLGGIGGFWWDFHENPELQDQEVIVDVSPSLAFRVGGGFDLWLTERWALNFEIAYFDTQIPKHAENSEGQVWNILGDEVIGHEQTQISFGARYRF